MNEWKKLNDRAIKICDHLCDILGEKIPYRITIPAETKDHISANFVFPGSDLSKCEIEICVCNASELKCTQKLRVWDASLTIIFIHEAFHYKFYEEMSEQERKISYDYYEQYKTFSNIEEVAVWAKTIKFLKRIRKHRNKFYISALKGFDFPSGFKVEF
jgi:hypothetical protein